MTFVIFSGGGVSYGHLSYLKKNIKFLKTKHYFLTMGLWGYGVPKGVFWGRIWTPKNGFLGLYSDHFLCHISGKIGGGQRK